MLERIHYPQLGPISGPYVHAVRHDNTLYLSGLTAWGTPACGQSVSDQAREIFRQITVVAEAERTTLAGLIKVTLFVTDISMLGDLRATLFDCYGGHLPASSLVEVSRLFSDEISIEIEAVLALDAR